VQRPADKGKERELKMTRTRIQNTTTIHRKPITKEKAFKKLVVNEHLVLHKHDVSTSFRDHHCLSHNKEEISF